MIGENMIWNNTEIANKLRGDFLTKVIENMRIYPEPMVRFGITGEGIQPNYEIISESKSYTYLGSNHQPNETIKKYDDDKLSESFSLKILSELQQ